MKAMNCEILLHGKREFMPFPEFSEVKDEKRVPMKQQGYPYRCLRSAKLYEVRGFSFSTTATLCEAHAESARKEDFVLVPEKE
jgi:hypothetical protein